jgi:CRP/FNR family transcriptional regulator, cyclic AMP receptor protein
VALTEFKPTVFKAEKTTVRSQEIVHVYSQGEMIFSQGDPGGDLLFIDSGTVEIFIVKNGQEISLAQMSGGEIIGVMTFLTKDARLASARAILPTKIKKIPSVHVQKYISTFPKWLKIVLKEFVGRINEMNRKYSETMMELKKAKEFQITPLFLATQLASGAHVIGKGCAKGQAGSELVTYDDLVVAAQAMLNQPKKMVESLLEIFETSELLLHETEAEKKQQAYTLKNLENLAIFTHFVRDSGQGQTKKILKASFSEDDRKILKGLARFLLTQSNPKDKAGVILWESLDASFEKLAGVKMREDVLDRASKCGLLTLKEDEPRSITLTPQLLLRAIACTDAMLKLNGEDGQVASDTPKEQKAS